jgi:hypothetical protein
VTAGLANLPPEPTPADTRQLGKAEDAAKQPSELPSVPPLDGLTLADVLIGPAQATEQQRSAPPQNLAPYVAELSPLELAIVRHAALAVLCRSSLCDEVDLDQALEMLEEKRHGFWEKLFKPGNNRKGKGALIPRFVLVGLVVLRPSCTPEGLFRVPLELLVESDGVDSLLGASRATLRVPSFVNDVISASQQMGALCCVPTTACHAHRY